MESNNARAIIGRREKRVSISVRVVERSGKGQSKGRGEAVGSVGKAGKA